MEPQQQEFLRSDDLAARYGCSKRTIYRWMTLEKKPFPRPTIDRVGMSPLWARHAVIEWETAGND
jgi:predicted DNA-binding transcriptional regulator AlpA